MQELAQGKLLIPTSNITWLLWKLLLFCFQENSQAISRFTNFASEPNHITSIGGLNRSKRKSPPTDKLPLACDVQLKGSIPYPKSVQHSPLFGRRMTFIGQVIKHENYSPLVSKNVEERSFV